MVEPFRREDMDGPIMRALFASYYQDKNGIWHQPGNIDELDPAEARELASRGAVRIIETAIETAMVEQPETRVVQMRRKRR